MDVKIRCLGTSGKGVSVSRTTTSFLVDSLIAVDCCEGFSHKLLSLNISRIPLILISHMHADHIIGLFMWLWRSYIYEREKRSPIILIPKDSREDLIQITKLVSFPPNPETSYFDIRGIALDDKPFEIDLEDSADKQKYRYKISWIQAVHHDPTYAYKIEKIGKEGSKSVVFSSDTRYNEALIEHAKNADILFHEATFFDDMHEELRTIRHACPSDAARIGSKANVKKT